MFKQIKKNNFFYVLLLFILPFFSTHSNDCSLEELLKVLKKDLTAKYKKQLVNEKANSHALDMKSLNLTQTSYMVKWKLKRKNQSGPWAMEGNTFINGIKQQDGKKWMKEVGMKSFGLGFEKLPGQVTDTPTAVLRWKNHFLYFGNIQGDIVEDLTMKFDYSRAWTESTFMASEEELQAIKLFFESRTQGEIIAKRKIRSSKLGTIEVGERINPEFDFEGENLFEESCAYACTSMINPRWLEHYDAPRALQLAILATETGIRPEVNAKALIYYNFRNTQASAITVLGLPNNTTSSDFIQKNEWSQIGGMMWGFIPDRMPSKPSPNYINERFTISDWLSRRE